MSCIVRFEENLSMQLMSYKDFAALFVRISIVLLIKKSMFLRTWSGYTNEYNK